MTCRKTTSGAGCRASSRPRCEPTWPLPAGSGRSPARGATAAQVALAWVLAQGRYVIPIPGTKTPTYLLENAGAADVELSAADLTELDALPAPEGARY